MISLILAIINYISAWNDINHAIAVVIIILHVLEIAVAIVSVINTKKYFTYSGKINMPLYYGSVSSKSWPVFAIILGVWGSVGCYIYTASAIKRLPKICNQCGCVTQNQYSICKQCLTKNDFKLVNSENIKIDNSKKRAALTTMICGIFIFILWYILYFFVL